MSKIHHKSATKSSNVETVNISENVEFELEIKLPDEVICPYCKGTGKYPEWYNDITDEIVNDNCNACNGTGWCDKELAGHFKEEDENEPLPF